MGEGGLTSWSTGLRLLAIVFVGICLRVPNLFSPYLLDAHAFRQGDTAGFALGYLTESFNPLHPSIARQPCGKPEPFGRVEAELPLYAWLAIVPLKLMGIDFPSAPYLRLCWLLYFSLSCVYLALLVRRLGAPRRIAEMCVATYAVLPISIFFTVSIQPDGPSLTFAFAALYHFAALLDRPESDQVLGWGPARKHEIAFVVSAALLLLAKLSNAYLGLPLLFVLVHFAGWRALCRPRVWLWLGVILLGTAAWYYYSRQVSSWSFGIWDDKAWGNKWSNWESLTDPGSWKRFGNRAVDQIFTWPGIALMTIGFALQRRNPPQAISNVRWRQINEAEQLNRGDAERKICPPCPVGVGRFSSDSSGGDVLVRLAAAWLVGFLVLLVATVPVQKIHIYYQLPLVVPAALTVPYAIEVLWKRKVFGRVALSICGLLSALTTYLALASGDPKQPGFFKEDLDYVAGIELVKTHVPAGEMFVSEPGRPELYYNSHHRGFTAPRNLDQSKLVQCMDKTKTRFLLIDDFAIKQLGRLEVFGFELVAKESEYALYRRRID